MQTISDVKCFGGRQGVHSHASKLCGGEMTFGLYLPPQAESGKVPLLWFLSGLTCTHENAMVKAGAQAVASEAGVAVAFPDTSPRGDDAPDDERVNLGMGAGFYVDATQAPWAERYQMRSYLLTELSELLFERFPLNPERQGITGHSMGGHGALTLAMTNPDRFRSLSAFAPIAHPPKGAWASEALTAYLGADQAAWAQYDSASLMREKGWGKDILVDQGADDNSWDNLAPEHLRDAMAARGLGDSWRLQPGYEHSYFFVSTFMPEHVRWHAARLNA